LADDDPSLARRARSNIAQYFGRLAHSYGDGEYYIRRRAAVVAAIADEIAHARRVLDLGCGNGRYLHEFRKSAPAAMVIGVDLSAEMIAQARLRNGAETPLIRADATAVPLREGALDIIFASHVFKFVSDQDATMRGLARCLSPGGAIILTVGGAGIREAMHGFVSDEQWSQFARAAFPGRRRIVAMEDEEPHREAMSRAGLGIETRDARFSITWTGWAPFMDEEQRRTATRILDAMAPRLSSRSFDLSERLLIGRRPRR
jgi:ubiquinone/menaquinone biosynthesis C-methylase UbiE